MEIDTLKNRVLMWSGGAGLVYAVDLDWVGDPIRIDKSVKHRNQYEHGHLISPIDGSIMLFGGYGFWQDKDIFTFFDEVNGQWDIKVFKGNQWPSRRTMPTLNYWKNGNKIVLFGGRASTEPTKPYVTLRRTVFDIWTFDLSTSIWELQGELKVNRDELVANEIMLGFLTTPRSGVLQKENLLIGMDHYNSTERSSNMYAIDLETMEGSFIDVQTGALSKFERLLAYFINEQKRQVYLLWTPLPINNRAAPIYVSTIDLPPADSIRANIRRMVALADNNWVEPEETAGSGFLIPLLLLVGVAIPLAYWRHRRSLSMLSSSAEADAIRQYRDSNDDTVKIIAHEGGTSIVFAGNDISIHFSPDELDLFLLLSKQYQNTNRYISTEQIEQAIWELGTNPDYSRKMRNQVQKKLEDNLQIVLPKPDGSVWIQSRSEPSDKRRKEYALNPYPYKIEF
jgi:hypothetical protein